MLTGDIRNKVDQVWNSVWTGGIANRLEVIEQITYLFSSPGWTSCTRWRNANPRG